MNGNANQQPSQRFQRRDGYSSAPRPNNFRAQPAHTNTLTRSDNVLQTPVYGQTSGGVIPYTAAAAPFQQAVMGAYPQGQPAAIYQMQQPYYTVFHYTPTTAYMAATTGVPQTLVMPQQQHHQQQAVHQQMANVVVTTSTTGQQQIPSSTAHQQQQPSEKKILVFCDPTTKKELDLHNSLPTNDVKRTEEADKTSSSKHSFLKQVAELFERGTGGGNLMKAVAGNANVDVSGGGEAAPAVNLHPTSAKAEVPQTLVMPQQQQQAVHQHTAEEPPVVISPPAEDEEEKAVPGDTETMGGGSGKGSQNDLNGEEESAADQLTPTQDGSEEMTEEQIRELEEQMQLLEKSDENNDPEQFVYSRKFLYIIRKVTSALKTVNCPKTEDELEELGLSRRGMPAVQSFSAGGKAKRFDGASSDQFKTAWQQPGGGLNQFGTGSDGRFTTSRPPYSGRHSDNKLKPKKVIASWGPIARQSLDQRPLKSEQISGSQTAELSKRSSNAWKPKREERFDINAPTRDEDEIKYKKLCKEVRGLLNKVTPSTYKDLSEDFIKYKIHEDPKLLEMIIDLIFDKAVEEPHFCPLYSDLCKRQVEEEKRAMADKQTQEKTFRSEIVQKCQKTFLVSNQFDEKISELKKKMDELDEADEKARAQVEEEIETRRSKEKRRLLGIIRFISQLYRHYLLIDRIINWCAVELIKRYEITKDEVYIEYAVELLATVGKVYEKRQDMPRGSFASVAQDQKVQDNFSFDKICGHLTTLKKDMSNRIRFAIQELEDLRQNKWMPRGGEKGPKTIEEVREEVEKEQQENEMERIEHDNKQKEREKIQLMSRKKPHPSYAASVHTAIKVESRISVTSKLKDVDNVSGLGGSRMKFDHHNRDRVTKKEDSAASTSTGGAAGCGGGTSSSGTSWRSKSRLGTDTSKDTSNQGGGD
uniref:MIF4G domain-containing protein n=1 Tax=Globodera rostochiensis TaxID=31243 RepID=A0A914GRP5_GLORO